MLDKYEMIKLNNIANKFFPKNGGWRGDCFNKEHHKKYDMIYLPCNLNNNEWLVEMFNKEIPEFPKEIIEVYIETNPYFEKKRREYEQEIVKWQIEYMNNGGDGWICNDDFFMFNPDCDKVFRDGIYKTLTAINMDEERVEEGIEKNRDLWLEKWIKSAFDAIYDPIWYKLGHDNLPNVNEEHYKLWRKLRLYEYYNNHKNSIDKYGTLLDEMIMTDEEVEELKEKLDIEDFKRRKIIEKYRKYDEEDSIVKPIVSSVDPNEYSDPALFTEVLDIPKQKRKK